MANGRRQGRIRKRGVINHHTGATELLDTDAAQV